MGLFSLLRFTSPNASVTVSEAGTDLSTTQALGLAVQNLDTHAANKDTTNTFTAAQTFSAGASVSNGATINGGLTMDTPLALSGGGTGAAALTNHGVAVLGASAFATVAPSTNGNVLTSNGTDWVSSAPSSGGAKKLGSAIATTNQAITSTASPGTDVTGLSVTCTPDGTHDVKITVSFPDLATTIASDAFHVAIQKGAGILNVFTSTTDASGGYGSFSFTHIDPAPAASSTTYKVSAWVNAGTLNTIKDASTAPTNLLFVEQVG